MHHHMSLTTTQFALLIGSGVITAAPLLLFGAAAQRLQVITIGLLQYVTPVMQLLWAVLVRHEMLSTANWIGFSLVWLALLMFTTDVMRRARSTSTACTVRSPRP